MVFLRNSTWAYSHDLCFLCVISVAVAQKPRWNRGVKRGDNSATETRGANAESGGSQAVFDASHGQAALRSAETRETSARNSHSGGGGGLSSMSAVVSDHIHNHAHGSPRKESPTPRTRNKFAEVLSGIVDRGREKSDTLFSGNAGQTQTSTSHTSSDLTSHISPTNSPGVNSPMPKTSPPRTGSFRAIADALAASAEHHKSEKRDKGDKEQKKKKRIIHRRQRSSDDGAARPAQSLISATLAALHPAQTSPSPVLEGLETIPSASPRTRRSNSMDMATMVRLGPSFFAFCSGCSVDYVADTFLATSSTLALHLFLSAAIPVGLETVPSASLRIYKRNFRDTATIIHFLIPCASNS